MRHFRKIWDAEKNAFLKSTKGMDRHDALALFREKWPEADVTDCAFYNQRSRMGAAENRPYNYHGARKPRPLYSEQIKKGYVRIKIAQPGTWVSKAKWVYMETHPWEDFTERSNYIFLDGAPELTRLNLLRARLKKAQLDALEKHGQIGYYGHMRRDKMYSNIKAKEYREKNKERLAERQKKRYWENHEEMLSRQREYRAKRKAQGGR